jgi:hypothetical protein
LNSSANLFAGNGGGAFQGSTSVPTGDNVATVISADFNGDGFPDLAQIAGDAVIVLLNHGDGSFDPPVSYPVLFLCNPQSILAADVDANGTVDIVTADDFDALRDRPLDMVFGDFDRDGEADLIVTYREANKLSTLRGQ